MAYLRSVHFQEVPTTAGLAVATTNEISSADREITLGTPGNLPIQRTPLSDQSIALESAQIVIVGGRGLDEAEISL